MAEHVTLEDIAAACELSKATVSRALSGHPRVAESTRERVQETADRLGYKPDAAMLALARRRWPDGRKPSTTQICYLHNFTYQHPAITGYRRSAGEQGYELLDVSFSEIGDADAFAADLIARNIRGVIFHSINDAKSMALPLHGLAAVAIGHGLPELHIHRVTHDLRNNIARCIQAATEHGYRRIGFVCTRHPSADRMRIMRDETSLRLSELEQALGPQPKPFWFTSADPGDGFLDWYETERPDVIVADFTTHYPLLLEAGIAIPDQLGYISMMVRSNETEHEDVIAHVRIRRNSVFRHALNLLNESLMREEWGPPRVPVQVIVGGRWHAGASLRSKR